MILRCLLEADSPINGKLLANAFCLILCLCCFSSITALADDPNPPRYTTTFPYFPDFVNGKDVYKPLVPVRLDNNTTAIFLIDTGANSSYITETQAKKLGIPFKPIPSEVRTDMQKDAADYVPANILIGHIRLPDVPLLIVKDKKIPSGDQPVDGILGNNFLSAFSVLFDFSQHLITLTTPGGVTADDLNQMEMTDATMVPLISVRESEVRKRPGVYVQMSNGFHVAAQDLIVDTGAAGTIISLTSAQQLALKPIGSAQNWQSFDGNVPVYAARVNTLRMGDLIISNPQILYNSGMENTYYSISLGMDVLRNYRMLLDYKNMKMYLKPNPWVPPASTDTLSAPPSAPVSAPASALPAGK